jgi:hypothetical protein
VIDALLSYQRRSRVAAPITREAPSRHAADPRPPAPGPEFTSSRVPRVEANPKLPPLRARPAPGPGQVPIFRPRLP